MHETGFNSMILRLPHDNIGIAVMTNGETGENFIDGYVIAQTVTYRLLDEALGLEPIQDWKHRFDLIVVPTK
jgi:hypothetical protein